jgi:hypothetical protein
MKIVKMSRISPILRRNWLFGDRSIQETFVDGQDLSNQVNMNDNVSTLYRIVFFFMLRT